MPVYVRDLGPGLAAAGYRFTEEEEETGFDRLPWLRSPSDTDNLCPNCSRLNFRWLFSQPLSGHIASGPQSAPLSDGICLGLYGDIISRSFCQFCQLIVHALEYAADIEMLNEYDDWPKKEVWINNHFYNAHNEAVMVPAEGDTERKARLGIRFKSATEENLVFLHGGRRVLIQQIVEDPLPAAGRQLALTSTNLIRTIKNWIQPCKPTKDVVTANDGESLSIRLIDIRDQRVVGPIPMTDAGRYIALSYIWGKIEPLVLLAENEDEICQKGALRSHKARLPVTIRDAITLCAQMGERYLWVDSLCIMQDTPDKHSQIQKMDQIYMNAALCIVAAAGRSANEGLAGITKPRDKSQHIIEVDGIHLANVIPGLTQSVTQTFWSRRAWCFQEDLLSQHKIVFTSDQTYYACPHGVFTEDAHSLAHESSDTASMNPPWLTQIGERTNWSIYCDAIEDYTSRMLSFDADVLNAFAGISAFLSKMIFGGSPFIMGIPICSLEAGLLWRPNGRIAKRKSTDFPSWSWAGWTAHEKDGFLAYVEYSNLQDHEKEFERTLSQVTWHISDQHNLANCLPEASWSGWKDWTRVISGHADEVHYIHKSSTGHKFAHPIVDQPWPKLPYSPLLQCTADIAQLTITSEHTALWDEQAWCEDGHELCHLKVLDHLGRFAGVVIIDGRTFEIMFEQSSITQKPCYFMKISRTTYTSQHDPDWDPVSKTFAGKPGDPGINPHETPPGLEDEFDYEVFDRNICWCMYNVLAVSFEENVATRLAVGRVYYSAFDDAGSEKRRFTLG